MDGPPTEDVRRTVADPDAGQAEIIARMPVVMIEQPIRSLERERTTEWLGVRAVEARPGEHA